MKTLMLIPHYSHPAAIAHVAQTMHGFGLDILIVDGGSREEREPVLQALVSDGVRVLYRPIDGGRGAAIKAGLKYAEEHGHSHILQVDADGQHHLDDTSKPSAVAEQNPEAVVCGQPRHDGDASRTWLYGRKATDFWNMLYTWPCDIEDGMYGFRLYPLAPAFSVAREETVGDRMDLDTEILIRLYRRGVKPVWIKTPAQYAVGGAFHFDASADNVCISKVRMRLFLGMLRRRLGTLFRKSRLKQ